MVAVAALVVEMNALRVAVKAHHAKIVAACEARDEAAEAAKWLVIYGRYVLNWEKDSWRYPAVAAAHEVYEKLSNDSGYFWACSRLADLEGLLGEGMGPRQLPLRSSENYVPLLRGYVPEAHKDAVAFMMEAA